MGTRHDRWPREEHPVGRTADAVRGRHVVDPRLLIGVGLVAVSVAGVVGLVSAVDARTTVYAAAGPLSPGDRIDRGDLVERSVVARRRRRPVPGRRRPSRRRPRRRAGRARRRTAAACLGGRRGRAAVDRPRDRGGGPGQPGRRPRGDGRCVGVPGGPGDPRLRTRPPCWCRTRSSCASSTTRGSSPAPRAAPSRCWCRAAGSPASCRRRRTATCSPSCPPACRWGG